MIVLISFLRRPETFTVQNQQIDFFSWLLRLKCLSAHPESFGAGIDSWRYFESAIFEENLIEEETFSCSVLSYNRDDSERIGELFEEISGLFWHFEFALFVSDELQRCIDINVRHFKL